MSTKMVPGTAMTADMKRAKGEQRAHMAEQLPIRIRDAEEADAPFIFSSWLKSFRTGLMCRSVDNTIYYTEHHKVIEKLLKSGNCKIACDEQDASTIFGYMCYERIDGIFVLHYAYTKHTFRKLGVQRAIMKEIEHDFQLAGAFTHSTDIAERLCNKFNLVYHPYILINYTVKDKKDAPVPEVADEK